jgi:opacity protein-like surface antigen
MKATLFVFVLAAAISLSAVSAAAVDKVVGVEAGYGYLVSAKGLTPGGPSGYLANLYYGYAIGDSPRGSTVLSLALGYSLFPQADSIRALNAVVYGVEYAHTFFAGNPVSLFVSYGLLFNLVLLEGRSGYAFGHDTRLSVGPVFSLGEYGDIVASLGYNWVTFPYFELASTQIMYPSVAIRYQKRF